MKHLTTILLLILTFDLSAQDEDPIPMWNEIVPDTIQLSRNFDTLLIPSICQDLLGENRTYKKFHFYYRIENGYHEGSSFKVYNIQGLNCNEIYCSTDTINKYNLTELAVLTKGQDEIEIKYTLVEKKQITELEAINKTEYTLNIELYNKGKIIYNQKIRVASNKKWKTLKPVQINIWQTAENTEKIILLDITENYFTENKVNLRQTKRVFLKI